MDLMIFCWLLGVTTVFANPRDFYFPDQIGSKAEANSQAWSDGFGNSQANANSHAISSSNGDGGSRYPNFYKPNHALHGHDYGGHGDYDGRYPSQGYGSDYENFPPYDPHQQSGHGYPPFAGNSHSNSNAQASSQGFGGTGISNAIANSQSLGTNGGASSAAAAASAAGTSFVNGIPVSSASAAAAAAAANPHGASAASSSASAGGNGGFQGRPYPNRPFGFDRPYQQVWQYRSGFNNDDTNDEDVVESAAAARSNDSADVIVFKD